MLPWRNARIRPHKDMAAVGAAATRGPRPRSRAAARCAGWTHRRHKRPAPVLDCRPGAPRNLRRLQWTWRTRPWTGSRDRGSPSARDGCAAIQVRTDVCARRTPVSVALMPGYCRFGRARVAFAPRPVLCWRTGERRQHPFQKGEPSCRIVLTLPMARRIVAPEQLTSWPGYCAPQNSRTRLRAGRHL